jgi:hypothetical protein
MTHHSTMSLATAVCKETHARFFIMAANRSARGGAIKLCLQFAKTRSTRIPIRFCGRTIVALGLLLTSGQLQGQRMLQFSEGASRDVQTNAPVGLPQTAEEIDGAVARIETRLNFVRLKVSAPKITETAAVISLAASPDELMEREQLLQRWVIALEQHGRHLRSLKEIRRLNQERSTERESWRGFVQPPTVLMAEQLTDAVSARRLELRTAQMLLSILEGEIARYATRLNESHKQLRLAQDQAEQRGVQDLRRQWLIQLAQFRDQADEASVETAEIGRLVNWEALDAQRKHIEFLERKLAVARAQARITRSDLDGVVAQISEKRTALQKELHEAIVADKESQASRDKFVDRGRAARNETATEPDAAVEVENAKLETSGQKIELLCGFLRLADYAQTTLGYRTTQPETVAGETAALQPTP